jgi:Tol biopolymer transport system component
MDEKKREITRHGVLQTIVVLLVVTNVLQAVFLVRSQKESAPGRIVYLRENRVDREAPTELVMIDGEGSREQRLGSFTSSPAWSHDGRFIAVGCADPSKICILDISTTKTRVTYPTGNKVDIPIVTVELNVPQPCAEINGRVISVSWSPSGQELALVCIDINVLKEREVCVLSLENHSFCWNHTASAGIWRVVWSPVNVNQLLISTGPEDVPEIYITDRNGENRVFLDNGWSPAWSFDGKRIAFFRWRDGVNEASSEQWLGGIATVRPDGTGLTWLFQPWNIPVDPTDYIYFNIYSPEYKLNWSPDDQYIVFSGSYIGLYNSDIFRLNIDSGEIILLSNPINRYTHNTDPDWGL